VPFTHPDSRVNIDSFHTPNMYGQDNGGTAAVESSSIYAAEASPQYLSAMEQALQSAMDNNSEVRLAAEKQVLEFLHTNPFEGLRVLPAVLSHCDNDAVRSLAAVLLRKHFEAMTSTVPGPQVPAVLLDLRVKLLQALANQRLRSVRLMIADTFAELASAALYEGHWDAVHILEPLSQLMESNVSEFRELGAIIVYKLSDCICDVDVVVAEIQAVRNMLIPLLDDGNVTVRVSGLRAVGGLITSLVSLEDMRTLFLPLLPKMVQILSTVMEYRQAYPTIADDVLQIFAEMCASDSLFFKDHLEEFNLILCQLASCDALDNESRQLALESLVTIAENAPALYRKSTVPLQQLLTVIMSFLLCVNEDDVNWAVSDSHEGEDSMEESNLEYGEEALDRLAQSIGGVALNPHYLVLLKEYLMSSDWRFRNAGLLSLAQVGEVLPYDTICQLVELLVGFLRDGNLRVQHSAINSLGQMSSDFGPKIQIDFHNLIVPALVEKLSPEYAAHIRVQAHAAAALINFSEQCDKQILLPYLDHILSRLFDRLQNGSSLVQEQVITAIASLADSAGTYFVNYYGIFIPIVKNIIAKCFPFGGSATSIDTLRAFRRELKFRGRALECFSFVATAVTIENSLQDCHEIMRLIMEQENLIREAAFAAEKMTGSRAMFEAYFGEDPSFSYIMQAWTRLFSIARAEFKPYLGSALEFAYIALSLGTRIQKSDESGEFERAAGLGSLDEKAAALDLITALITLFQNDLAPHVEVLSGYLSSMLTFPRCDQIRKLALTCFPHLLTISCRCHPPEFVKAFYIFVFDNLVNAALLEFDMSVQSNLLYVFRFVSFVFVETIL
jgi:HEAT repeat protein